MDFSDAELFLREGIQMSQKDWTLMFAMTVVE
jgi:hypothetical protein